MMPIFTLWWFYNGEWREIGWTADTEQSLRDLRAHAEKLSASDPNGRYQLRRHNIVPPPFVVAHEWGPAQAVTT